MNGILSDRITSDQCFSIVLDLRHFSVLNFANYIIRKIVFLAWKRSDASKLISCRGAKYLIDGLIDRGVDTMWDEAEIFILVILEEKFQF